MRIALGIEYLGGAYHGWQSQAGGGTVQDAMQAALAAIAGCPISVIAAGRTDAGVHATAQVLHFDIDAAVQRPLTAWVRGVNRFLPKDIAVSWAQPVPDDFHARFSATSRRYRYYLLNRPVRPGVMSGRMGWHHLPIDLAKMRQGAAALLGEHDFSAFRAAECQARSPVKTMRRATVAQAGEVFVFDFEADAFLHHMVRNLVGSLVHVGIGRQAPDWIAELLVGGRRQLAAPTFSPAGLYLVGVGYDRGWGLPSSSPLVFPWEQEE